MILSFKVKNFLSIRDEQTISFEANKADKTLKDLLTVEVKPHCFVNKMGIFYGANASGKSNILYAIEAVFKILYLTKQKEDPIFNYSPFALRKGEPTEFNIIFFIEGVQYDYTVSYNQTNILSELLHYYPNGSKALFYKRKYIGENIQPKIEFGNKLKLSANTKKDIKGRTFNNQSVLGSLGNLSLTEEAYELIKLYVWAIKYVHDIDGDYVIRNMIAEIDKVCNDSKLKQFYLDMLAKADFNIINFNLVDDRDNMSRERVEYILSEKNITDEDRRALLSDVSFVNHSTDGDFSTLSKVQSDGTKRYIELLRYLYEMITDNHICLFDELGNEIHYDLLAYYLLVFLRNSNQSQLLFTTHSIMLLDEEFVRRDMVYLAEKDKDTAVSSYTRVSDMGLHKNISLYKAYKIGRLGAKPDLGSTYLDFIKEC